MKLRYLEKVFLSMVIITVVFPISLQLAFKINPEFTALTLAQLFRYLGIQKEWDVRYAVNMYAGLSDVVFAAGYFGCYIVNRWQMGLERGESTNTILCNGEKPFTGNVWGDGLVMLGLFLLGAFSFWFFVIR